MRSASSVWIVIFKKETKKQVVDFNTVVEEAICHGWIDSKIKKIDDESYTIYLTPRKPRSHWTEGNRLTAQRMIAEGRMTVYGMDVFATEE